REINRTYAVLGPEQGGERFGERRWRRAVCGLRGRRLFRRRRTFERGWGRPSGAPWRLVGGRHGANRWRRVQQSGAFRHHLRPVGGSLIRSIRWRDRLHRSVSRSTQTLSERFPEPIEVFVELVGPGFDLDG